MKIRKLLHLGSAFIVSLSSLFLVNFGTALAAGYTCTWTGAGNGTSFSDAANWSGCNSAAPVAGDADALVFDDTTATNVTPNNDLSGATFSSITFQGNGTNGSFTVSGNAFTLTGGITDTGGGDFNEIDNNVTLSGDQIVTMPGGSFITLAGSLNGSGALTKTGLGDLILKGDNSSYTGALTISAGNLDVQNGNALATSGGTTIGDGASANLTSCAITQYAGNLTLTGVSSDTTGDIPVAKITVGGACKGGGSPDEVYGESVGTTDVTLTGNITLGSDVTFAGVGEMTTLTGAISGAHKINMVQGYGGKLIVKSSSNTSDMPNGTYVAPVYTKTLSDKQPTHTVYIMGQTAVSIDGTRGDTVVEEGATLMGSGTVGNLNVDNTSYVAPGHSPGCLSTGNLTLNGTYQAQLGGTTACSGYDQLNVTGTVDVTNATLNTSLYGTFKPKAGNSFTIINNDGTDKVTGTFSGLKEGATFKVSGYVFKISYVGGTGNDVVLSVVSVPTTPDTGFAFTGSNPTFVLAGTTASALILLVIGRKTKLALERR